MVDMVGLEKNVNKHGSSSKEQGLTKNPNSFVELGPIDAAVDINHKLITWLLHSIGVSLPHRKNNIIGSCIGKKRVGDVPIMLS